MFTHQPHTNGKENEKLRYNIDPHEKDKDSYVRTRYFVSVKDDFEPALKNYRIHISDVPRISKHKK